jgi:cytochrome b561
MHFNNTLTEYGLISKVLHWLSAILLLIQIPLGFYLVDLDFGEARLTFENIHIIIGLTIFYLVIIRLVKNIINPTPKLNTSIFKGQKFLAKINHLLLYVTILSITISGILKKLYNGESLIIIFKKIKIEDNFELSEIFYDVHVFSNYVMIALIALHVVAVIIHKFFFDDNLLKKIT